MRTLATLEITLANLLDQLGERAAKDLTGADIIHDIRGCLQAIEGHKEPPPPTRLELVELTDRTAAIRARALAWLAAEEAGPQTPTPEEMVSMLAAQAGPRDDETLETCPACVGCPLCKDSRMVTVRAASAWRLANESGGEK